MAKIKISGLTHDVEIGIMNELVPDYAGFSFYSKSKHFIAPEHAGLLRSKLRKGIKAVGTFVNASLKSVAMTVEIAGLDMVQLHGDETGEYIAALREYIRCPIIKAFRVSKPMDAEKARYSTADYVLLDGQAGGGKSFDWNLLGGVRRKYFLAGGLNPENFQKALEISPPPYALDVNTGVEANRLKDYRKVMKFILGVKSYYKQNQQQL